MIRVSPVVSDGDAAFWLALRTRVAPREGTVPLRRGDDRLFLLAELDGVPVGCARAGRSDLTDSASVGAYVLPEARRRGVGSALFARLVEHARTLGRDHLFATVDERAVEGLAFAGRCGLVEVDREIELRRALGDEPAAAAPAGIDVVTIAERPELLEAAYHAIAIEGYADLPLPGPIEVTLEEWLEEEATVPEGSFVALDGDAPVGYAGLTARPEEGIAENGLTAVCRSHRRRGIAEALKRRQLAWAAAAGYRELVSYTQGRNIPMQRLNERLGYVAAPAWIKLKGPLP